MHYAHAWIRKQLICCFIYTYTHAMGRPPSIREIGEWVGCTGRGGIQRALAALEAEGYLRRERWAGRSIVLTEKGVRLGQRWQLSLPAASA